MQSLVKNKRRLNPNLIKKNRAYTLAEIAEIYNKHIRTIQTWVKKGLPVVDPNSKPKLALGFEVRNFIRNNNENRKIKLKENQFYCTKCRVAREAIQSSIEIEFTSKIIGKNQKQAIIKGLCSICRCRLRKFSTEQKVIDLVKREVLLTECPLILIENNDQ